MGAFLCAYSCFVCVQALPATMHVASGVFLRYSRNSMLTFFHSRGCWLCVYRSFCRYVRLLFICLCMQSQVQLHMDVYVCLVGRSIFSIFCMHTCKPILAFMRSAYVYIDWEGESWKQCPSVQVEDAHIHTKNNNSTCNNDAEGRCWYDVLGVESHGG